VRGGRGEREPRGPPGRAAIRPALLDDADGIAHVHTTSWEETYRGILPDAAIDRFQASHYAGDLWRTRLSKRTEIRNFVAVERTEGGAERVIGFSCAGPTRTPELARPGEVLALYLLRERHGRGIGRALWDAALAALRERDLLPGHVWVLAENPAIDFYRRVGAVEFVRRPCRIEEAKHLDEVGLGF